jgi:hypothetical protein
LKRRRDEEKNAALRRRLEAFLNLALKAHEAEWFELAQELKVDAVALEAVRVPRLSPLSDAQDFDIPIVLGRLPKLALQQITSLANVVRKEKPTLTAEPTVVVAPEVRFAEDHMPNLGVTSAPVMPSAPPSNGIGCGGGIGSVSGGE